MKEKGISTGIRYKLLKEKKTKELNERLIKDLQNFNSTANIDTTKELTIQHLNEKANEHLQEMNQHPPIITKFKADYVENSNKLKFKFKFETEDGIEV